MWSLPLTNVKWHSDPWPTVTSQPIRLSRNLMTFIPSLTFTELWVVSMEHLQRVWHASRECLPFRTPGSVSLFGTCLYSNCWNQISRTCHVLTRLFTLNAPWYFLDFLYYFFFIFRVVFCCLVYYAGYTCICSCMQLTFVLLMEWTFGAFILCPVCLSVCLCLI